VVKEVYVGDSHKGPLKNRRETHLHT
jgi:hypothetical protein